MEFKKATLQEVSTKPSATPAPVGDAVPVQINPATLRLQASASVDSGKDTGPSALPVPGHDLDAHLRPRLRHRRRGHQRGTRRRAQAHRAGGALRLACGQEVRPAAREVQLRDAGRHRRDDQPEHRPRPVQRERRPAAGEVCREHQGAEDRVRSRPRRCGSEHRCRSDAAPATVCGRAGCSGRRRHRLRRPQTAPARPWPGRPRPRSRTGWGSILVPGRGWRASPILSGWRPGSRSTSPRHSRWRAGSGSRSERRPGWGAHRPAPTRPSPRAGSGTPTASGPVPATLPIDGRALAAAGGLTAALDKAAAVNAGLASQAASSAFTGPGATAPSTPPASPQSLGSTVAPPTAPSGASQQPPTASTPVGPDPRSLSYGYGVPLRPRRGTSRPTSIGLVHEIHRTIQQGGDMPPASRDATVPPWQALAATAMGSAGSSGGGCGCGGCGCGCGGRPDPRDRSGSTTKPCGCGGP